MRRHTRSRSPVPSHVFNLVIESFSRERITASDASDYLQVRLRHLSEIQRDYAKFVRSGLSLQPRHQCLSGCVGSLLSARRISRHRQSMDRAVQNGVLLTSDEVLSELSKKDDDAHAWVKSRPVMVVNLNSEIETHVREIMTRYPRLVDSKKGRSVGDPFVIAVARAKGLTVITGENPTRKIDVPRIPDVCEDLGIRWIGILAFFREQGWKL